MLRHENAVLRRQLKGPVRSEPADRFWLTALSAPPAAAGERSSRSPRGPGRPATVRDDRRLLRTRVLGGVINEYRYVA
ncbi:hypothetical protein ACWGPD_37595 [Streptomyces hirsutus]|uniref:hypothetical protein n=1 Tax=Streptomyces hirsutus TaxID=35620 RepID=UPI0036287942